MAARTDGLPDLLTKRRRKKKKLNLQNIKQNKTQEELKKKKLNSKSVTYQKMLRI
jgi:hypothetical protein